MRSESGPEVRVKREENQRKAKSAWQKLLDRVFDFSFASKMLASCFSFAPDFKFFGTCVQFLIEKNVC